MAMIKDDETWSILLNHSVNSLFVSRKMEGYKFKNEKKYINAINMFKSAYDIVKKYPADKHLKNEMLSEIRDCSVKYANELFEKQKFLEAISFYKKALEINVPKDSIVNNNFFIKERIINSKLKLALIFEQNKNFAEAKSIYEQTLNDATKFKLEKYITKLTKKIEMCNKQLRKQLIVKKLKGLFSGKQ